MVCPKCGKKLVDNAKFCGNCGAKVNFIHEIQGGENSRNQTIIVRPTTAVGGSKLEQEGTTIVKPRSSIRKRIAGIVVLAVVVLFALLGLTRLFRGDNAYIALSDGKYVLISDLDKGELIEIASSRGESAYMDFSPDGRYIYYFTKIDGAGNGTLNRAEYGKFKQGSSDNMQYVTTVGTNVNLFGMWMIGEESPFLFVDDDTMLYMKDDRSLYMFDGKNSERIARDVSRLSYNQEGKLVYYVASEDTGLYTMYTTDLSNPTSRTKLEDDICKVLNDEDLNYIVYTKQVGEREDLYTVGLNQEPELIESDISVEVRGDQTIYKVQTGSVSSYDFVIDEYSTQRPTEADYTVPDYSYYRLNSYSDLSSFDQVYTSCTIDLYFFDASIQEVAQQGGSAMSADCAAFVEKYMPQEDPNGFIVLTDTIRQELITLAQTYGQGYENEWQELCIGRRQVGTTVDYDGYYQALELYQLREDLRKSEEAIPLYTVKTLEDGAVKVIAENVITVGEYEDGILTYRTLDEIEPFINIQDITYSSEVYQYVTGYYSVGDVYIYLAEEKKTIECTNDFMAEIVKEFGTVSAMSVVDDQIVLEFAAGAVICVADIVDDTVGSYSVLTEEGYLNAYTNEKLYYLDNLYEEDGFVYGDLYQYKKDGSVLIMSGVERDTVNYYEDGTIFVYSERYYDNDGRETGDLVMIEANGDQTTVGYSITGILRIDKNTMFYFSEGDLYFYDGKNANRVATDTSVLCCREYMEPKVKYNYWV